MKAEIDQDGMLTIIPENGLEAFALDCWVDKVCQSDLLPSTLLIMNYSEQ